MPTNLQDRQQQARERAMRRAKTGLQNDLVIVRDALASPHGEAFFDVLVRHFDHEDILVEGKPDKTGERQGEKNVINFVYRLLRNEEKLNETPE